MAINGTRLARGNGAEVVALARRRWPRLLVSGEAFLILIEALPRGGAVHVVTLRNTSVLFAVAMSWRIGERPARAEVAGAALVTGFGLGKLPDAARMTRLAAPWRPYRTVAAWYMWRLLET